MPTRYTDTGPLDEQIKQLRRELNIPEGASSASASSSQQQTETPSVGVDMKKMMLPAAAAGAGYLATNGFSAMPSVANFTTGLGELTGIAGMGSQTATSLGTGAFEGITGSMSATPAASAFMPAAGAVAAALGAYQAYNLQKKLAAESRQGSKLRPALEGGLAGAGLGFGGAVLGAQLGTTIAPGVGTAIGAGLGLAAGAVGKMTASGKSKDQMKRDQIRKYLKEIGGLDEKWTAGLADGSRFDFGKDGGAKLTNADGVGTRKYNEIDWANPFAQRAVSVTNPLGYLLGGKDQKIALDMVGYNTNAVTSNAKDENTIDENARALYKQFGFGNRSDALAGLGQLRQEGVIDDEKYNAFSAEVSRLLPDDSKPAVPQQEQTGGGYDYQPPQEKKIDKKRLNSRFDSGFSAMPRGGEVSTGVNQYMAMLEQMNGRRA